MNKVYQLIWNCARQIWVPVAEAVSVRSKSTGITLQTVATILALGWAATSTAQVPPPANALPAGGQLVAGSASISQSGANMTIAQSSGRAAIDWNTFNVGSSASVHFLQPSGSAVVLNRVLSSSPSQIFGQISANGQVFLSNPAGVYFAPSASVDVGGLVATTHRIDTDQFMAGAARFTRNGATGSVINEGSLNAHLGGYIALLAPGVRNHGVVVAQAGTVAMAAGEACELQFTNSTLTNIQVEPATIAALVENGQAVRAQGGFIILSARAADQLQGSVVNNAGRLDATGLIDKGGRIVLTADHITLAAGSTLDASGIAGGGEVLVGGGWQGGGGLYQATTVAMAPDARIDVSATQSGSGGTAVLWSDVHNPASQTRVYGGLWAKGGAESGDGGRIETSGHWLDISGSTGTASASNGNPGIWMFDPYNVEISTTSANNLWQIANPTIGGTDVFSSFRFPPSLIAASDIASRLQNGSNVIVTTISNDGFTQGPDVGNITVNSTINATVGYDVGLTLQAANSIVVNQSIINSGGVGKLNLVLNADSDGNGAGGITVNAGATLATRGGNIVMGGSTGGIGGISCNSTACANAAKGTGLAGTGGISFNGTAVNPVTLDSGGGNINLWGSGPAAGGPGVLMHDASINSGATGSVSIRGDGIFVNTANGSGHGVYLDHTTVRAGGGGATIIGNGNANNPADGQSSAGLYLANGTSLYTTDSGVLAVNATNTVGNGNDYIFSDSSSHLGEVSLQNGDIVLIYSGTSSSPVQLPNIMLPSGDLTVTSHKGIAAGNTQTIAGISTLDGGGINFDIDLASSGAFDTGQLVATNVRHISVKDTNALILSAITAVGTVDIATLTGDLTIEGVIQTADNTDHAITLNASQNSSAGTPTGGDIKIGNSGTVTPGAGGFATLYSGSIANSTGLTSLIGLGSGSGRFRYNSDETTGTSNYVTPLTSGTNAVYRERPNLTIKADDIVATYGTYGTYDNPFITSSTISPYQNGDTRNQAVSGTVSIAIGGATSTSRNFIVGTHTLTPAGLTSLLGYQLTYSPGTLTQKPLNLTGSITAASSIYGSALNAGAVTLTNVVPNDVLTPTVSMATTGLTSSSDHLKAGVHPGIQSISALSGADAANYTFSGITAGDYTVTPLSLTGSIAAASSIYGSALNAGAVTLTNVVPHDVLTPAVSFATTSLTSTSGHLKAGVHPGIQSISALSGTDAANYTFSGITSGDYSVTPLALTGSITAASSTYGSALNAGAVTLTNVMPHDALTPAVSFATNGLTSTSGHLKAGVHPGIQSISALSGDDAANYTFSSIPTGDYTVTPLALTGAAIAGASTTYGNTAATGAVSFGNVVDSDLVGTTATLVNPLYSTSGHLKAASYAQITGVLAGADKDNYSFGSFTSAANYQAQPLELPVYGLTASNKVYDGGVSATLVGTPTVAGLNGDQLRLVGEPLANFTDDRVGTNKTVAVHNLRLSGLDAENYGLIQPTVLTASITNPYLFLDFQAPQPPWLPSRWLLPTPCDGSPEVRDEANAFFLTVAARSAAGRPSNDSVTVQLWRKATEYEDGLVTVSIPKPVIRRSGQIIFRLPENLFDAYNATDAIATDATGGALPNWLQFSATTQSFMASLTQSDVLPMDVSVALRRKRALITLTDTED